MNIGVLAKRCGVSTHTIRYYEKEGLMHSVLRQNNGYRLYSEMDIAQLQFIQTAKKLGFTLLEIRHFLPDVLDGKLYKEDLESKLEHKVIEIEKKIKYLQNLRINVLNTFHQLKCDPDAPINLNKLID